MEPLKVMRVPRRSTSVRELRTFLKCSTITAAQIYAGRYKTTRIYEYPASRSQSALNVSALEIGDKRRLSVPLLEEKTAVTRWPSWKDRYSSIIRSEIRHFGIGTLPTLKERERGRKTLKRQITFFSRVLKCTDPKRSFGAQPSVLS